MLSMQVTIRKFIYGIETVLVLLPTILFLIFSFPWLFAGLSLKAWGPSFTVFLLWVGGWLGIAALIQILMRLFSGTTSKISFLWVKSFAGIVSAITPILFAYSAPPDGGNRAGFLLFLCPIIVGAHWLWALKTIATKSE